MELPLGLYDYLRTAALNKDLAELGGHLENKCSKSLSSDVKIPDSFWPQFQVHVGREIGRFLKEYDEAHACKSKLFAQLPEILASDQFNSFVADRVLPLDGSCLEMIHNKFKTITTRPDTPLHASALLTGSGRTPKLVEQLRKELASCDCADWLVSFIKMSGINPLREALEDFCAESNADGSPRLRIATTSYMGATDPSAIDFLRKLPNTEIRVSYDTKRTRLHAKSYIFHRKTGFGSAYVGSANISKSALDDGLEWTVKISQYETAHLWNSSIASFDSHWEDKQEFIPCSDDEDITRLRKAINKEKNRALDANLPFFVDIRPYGFQQEILEAIELNRAHGRKKHLVVSATGTGKTMVAAFDYKNYCKAHPGATLLFLAHREEILRQAKSAFEQVLRDGNFGELVTGRDTPVQLRHLFCTVQSWNSRYKDEFPADYFKYVVIDEAHHAAASSYLTTLSGMEADSLLGLTATPERMDGGDILSLFGDGFTYELRLTEAIERGLLSPFHYYGIPDDEGIDFSRLKWMSGKYDTVALQGLLDDNYRRAQWVMDQVAQKVNDIREIRALAFCVSIRHAEMMAELCNAQGVASLALTSKSSLDLRREAPGKLKAGDLQIIFCVDLYNEGVDITNIDTVIFLRPTESLTVFLQQLGCGLRRDEGKSHLTVFDFIAPQHANFNYETRFRALSMAAHQSIKSQIEGGFSFLPTGCLIHLERKAAQIMKEQIDQAIRNMKGARLIARMAQLLPDGQERMPLCALMTAFDCSRPERIYRAGLPHMLFARALKKSIEEETLQWEKFLKDGFMRIALQSDATLMSRWQLALHGEHIMECELAMLHQVLWGTKRPVADLYGLHDWLLARASLVVDLSELLDWCCEYQGVYKDQRFDATGILRLHARYTRDQITMSLGLGSFEKSFLSCEGVLHRKNEKLHVFFADIHKDELDFAPTTMYEDYALTSSRFHWQSQSATTPELAIGRSYREQAENGYTVMLFIRDRKKAPDGQSAPYVFLGPLRFVSSTGSKPMSIVWDLDYPMPAQVLSWAKLSD